MEYPQVTRRLFYILAPLIAIFMIAPDLNASPYWDQFKTGENPNYAARMRIGFGPSVVIGDFDKKYKNPNPSFIIDYFFLRWRTEGNSGIDLYSRLGVRVLSRMDDSIESKTSIATGDIGVRFLLSSFFFPKLIHYYILAAPRFLYFREEITGDRAKLFNNSNMMSLGGTGGFGIEVSPFNNVGFFMEFNMGYCPVGESKDNADGPAGFIGVTYRSRVR